MQPIPFWKMSGSGNDFIVIDNRQAVLHSHDLAGFVRAVCTPKISLGADGLILLEPSAAADFKWQFFNSDGSAAEMCGNGARCVARFAYLNGIAARRMCFETGAGVVSAEVLDSQVKVKMPDPANLQLNVALDMDGVSREISCINTGVPHAIVPVEDVAAADVLALGKQIRFHALFAPAGTNVDFVSQAADRSLRLRTYERGVEDETMACGTGAVAAALLHAAAGTDVSPLTVVTRSGIALKVHFRRRQNRFTDVFLEGDARIICSGELWAEAWTRPTRDEQS